MHDFHTYAYNLMTPVYETMEHHSVETLKIMLIKNEIPKIVHTYMYMYTISRKTHEDLVTYFDVIFYL